MLACHHRSIRAGAVRVAAATIVAGWALSVATANLSAQVIQQAVGGVAISTEGVLTIVKTDALHELSNMRRKALAQLPGDLNKPAKLRMISLRRLQETIAACQKLNQLLPDEVRYLAGLQRVEYVFADPEHHDIVLAGPAEGWTINNDGEVVGRTTGRAVLRLDDLLVAFRTADKARNGGISCSIDPSGQGVARLEAYLSGAKPTTTPS